MAYDEILAERIRSHLAGRPHASERKMFGGLCFISSGNMICGVVADELMVRIGANDYESALMKPGARPMDFTGRPMKGMLYVNKAGIDAALGDCLEQAYGFAAALPPKSAKKAKPKTR